ncbi:MAG: DNA polymerase domain-containing protein [Ghiorsea sp.]
MLILKEKINGFYGATSNPYFHYFDVRIASAITTTGQIAIQHISNHVNSAVNRMLNTGDIDHILAIDTDAFYLDLSPFMRKNPNYSSMTDLDRVNTLSEIGSDIIEPLISRGYDDLGKYLNSYEQQMIMDREVVALRGFWIAKKKYSLLVSDNEGIRYETPQLKIMGLDVKKSSIPKKCQKALKECVMLMMKETNAEVIEYIGKFKEEFLQTPISDIAKVSSANNMEKFKSVDDIYIKGTPRHIKGALHYNYLLGLLGISEKYEEISSGDKIRIANLRAPNPYNIDVVCFPAHADIPDEFGLSGYVDLENMFLKTFLDPLENMLEAVEWKSVDDISLDSFF